MIAAVVVAAICLQHAADSTCLAKDVLSKVGDQLLSRVVTDARDLEQAAFLTRNSDGSLGCRLWPLTTEHAASTYRGEIPPDAIAIVHTHPHEWSKPSPQDTELSLRLNMAVLVVTHGWVSVVDPAGQFTQWVRYRSDQLAVPQCEPIRR
jgi:hypothetical protein